MNFIDKISTSKHKRELLEIKVFGWNKAVERILIGEDLMEEFIENFNLELILKHQDYSEKFEKKFKHFFEKKCNKISSHISTEEFKNLLNSSTIIKHDIQHIVYNKKDTFIGVKIIFTGPKGKELFERVKKIKYRETKNFIHKVYFEFNDKFQKNSMIINVDTTEKTYSYAFFVQ